MGCWGDIGGEKSRDDGVGQYYTVFFLVGEGSHWLKAVESAAIRTHGERGGSSPRKIGNAPRKFSSVAVILPEIRVSENLRERKREGKNYRFLPSKRQVTRILSDYFFFFFLRERSDIVRRCNLELELFSLLAPDISTRGSFFPWIRRGVS